MTCDSSVDGGSGLGDSYGGFGGISSVVSYGVGNKCALTSGRVWKKMTTGPFGPNCSSNLGTTEVQGSLLEDVINIYSQIGYKVYNNKSNKISTEEECSSIMVSTNNMYTFNQPLSHQMVEDNPNTGS